MSNSTFEFKLPDGREVSIEAANLNDAILEAADQAGIEFLASRPTDPLLKGNVIPVDFANRVSHQ